MRVTRFYATTEGGSSFDEVDIPIAAVAPDAWGNALAFSEPFASPAVRIFEVPAGSFQDWHNAPRRQICIMLQGVWEVGTTDGQKRRWGPGEVFFPADVDGKGHTSEVISGPVRMVFVPLPDDFDAANWRANWRAG